MAKIMIVDNDINTVETLKEILEMEGYDIVSAFGGKECFEKLTYTKVDLILLDIMMPEIDGIQICEKLTKNEKTKDIKIILISAISIASDTFKQNKEHFSYFKNVMDEIEKPFDADTLIKRVKAVLT
ncbi:MAG: response regulator [Candidatus Aenigmarchaeota archaeon]|nr:response regulator [Candidatus Aenigmarchaeota archaeon]